MKTRGKTKKRVTAFGIVLALFLTACPLFGTAQALTPMEVEARMEARNIAATSGRNFDTVYQEVLGRYRAEAAAEWQRLHPGQPQPDDVDNMPAKNYNAYPLDRQNQFFKDHYTGFGAGA